MKKRFIPFLKDDSGLVTTEFVIISFALFMTIFFALELTLVFFSIMASQEAAHMGARMAIVSNPVETGVPAVNALDTGDIFGTSCSDATAPCTGFSTVTCTGTACSDSTAFNRILARMQQFLPGLEAGHVTFSYAYTALGYAGGPAIPAVTVTISGVPIQTGVLGVFVGSSGGAFTTLPDVSVTLTGEDLSESGA